METAALARQREELKKGVRLALVVRGAPRHARSLVRAVRHRLHRAPTARRTRKPPGSTLNLSRAPIPRRRRNASLPPFITYIPYPEPDAAPGHTVFTATDGRSAVAV